MPISSENDKSKKRRLKDGDGSEGRQRVRNFCLPSEGDNERPLENLFIAPPIRDVQYESVSFVQRFNKLPNVYRTFKIHVYV